MPWPTSLSSIRGLVVGLMLPHSTATSMKRKRENEVSTATHLVMLSHEMVVGAALQLHVLLELGNETTPP